MTDLSHSVAAFAALFVEPDDDVLLALDRALAANPDDELAALVKADRLDELGCHYLASHLRFLANWKFINRSFYDSICRSSFYNSVCRSLGAPNRVPSPDEKP